MALVHAVVRWCKARLCTGFLVIVLCAVAWFALSASYHSLYNDPTSNSDIDYGADQRVLAAGADDDNGGDPAQNGDDDDDDVQICKYPLVAAAETNDAWDTDRELETCAPHPENLFYFEDGRLMTYDKVLDNKRLDRCEFRGIIWRLDSDFNYTEPLVRRPQDSFDVDIDHDFVHVQCYLEHRPDSQKHRGRNEALKEVDEADGPGSRDRRRRNEEETDGGEKETSAEKKGEVKGSSGSVARPKFQFHDVKDFHRAVVHRNAPRLVGSLGLPDFRDNIVGHGSSVINSKGPKSKESRHLLSEPDSYNQDSNEVDHKQHSADDQSPEQIDGSKVDNRPEGRRQDEGPSVSQSTKPSFDQFLVQVSEKPDVVERVTKSARPSSTSSPDQMNVLLLAIDSVSRTSFKMNFDSTSQFLAKRDLDTVIMKGYNSIGDAATAAVIPLITGFKEQEVHQMRRSGDGGQYVDSLPFVWNKFEQRGHVTLYAEDQPTLGTFQTHYYGFEEIPADHYMRPFWLAVSASNLDASSQPNCLGSIPKHKYTLDYISDFFRKYKSTPKFAFGFLSEFNQSRVVDDDLTSFLELLKKDGHLENTLLVVLGDHGKSYGLERYTVAGGLEERLPYLSLTFPAWFRTKYRQLIANLKNNRNRLTTAFDVHKTLLTLLDIQSNQLPVNATSRAISLLQVVPRQRTCMSAEVDVHWCTCVKFEQINDHEIIRTDGWRLANVAVEDINMLLETEDKEDKQCDRLTVDSVLEVRVVFPNEVILELENKLVGGQSEVFNISRSYPLFARYHQVVFMAKPGDAVFEATVVSSAAAASGSIINGQISRINAYAGQSDCIFRTHPDLRKYCHCTKH